MISAARDARGVLHYDRPKPRDLSASLRETVSTHPDKTGLIDRGRAYTWREFDAEVEGLAARLAGVEVGRGDRIGVLASNGFSFMTAVYASWRVGAIVVPLNYRLTSEDLTGLLRDSGTRVLLVGGDLDVLGAQAADGLDMIVDYADASGRFFSGGAVRPLPDGTPGPDEAAAIMYTSGTTGRPKGVVVTHANALENAVTCIDVIGRTAEDRELIMVPQFNVTGLCSQTVPAVQLGMTIITFGPFDATAAVAAIEEHRATSTVGAPTMWWRLVEAAESAGSSALRNLRLSLFGGAPMPTALLARMREAMPSATFGNGYGQTETCSMVTYAGGEDVLRRPDSIGRPLPITDLRIVDPETGSPTDGAGEILVRGGQIAAGYWTSEGLRPIADAEGWLGTGDVGLFDGEFVVLRDRIKDVIKRGGESVFSFEVEDCIAQHDDVMEAAVVGLPDLEWGEIVAAAIVPKPGRTLDTGGLREHCARSLARFKVPRVMAIVDALPRNAGGKVLKNDLRDHLISTRTMSDRTTTKE